MKFFIASPLFNKQQHIIIDAIEQLLTKNGHTFYSARHDSEPFVPKGEEKKNPQAWQLVFNNNEEGLEDCDIMISVLSYALPGDTQMGILTVRPPGDSPMAGHIRLYDNEKNEMYTFKPQELPDSGTVWEMGYFRALKKIVIGFHPEKRGDHLNLMLTHGCDGLLSGWNNLAMFLSKEGAPFSYDISLDRLHPGYEARMLSELDWSFIEQWGAQVGDE